MRTLLISEPPRQPDQVVAMATALIYEVVGFLQSSKDARFALQVWIGGNLLVIEPS